MTGRTRNVKLLSSTVKLIDKAREEGWGGVRGVSTRTGYVDRLIRRLEDGGLVSHPTRTEFFTALVGMFRGLFRTASSCAVDAAKVLSREKGRGDFRIVNSLRMVSVDDVEILVFEARFGEAVLTSAGFPGEYAEVAVRGFEQAFPPEEQLRAASASIPQAFELAVNRSSGAELN